VTKENLEAPEPKTKIWVEELHQRIGNRKNDQLFLTAKREKEKKGPTCRIDEDGLRKSGRVKSSASKRW